MAKYILRMICVLVILFLCVPFIASLGYEPAYSLPLGAYDVVSLEMPDGESVIISSEEFFSGTAAAFIPNESDEETLRAACVILNTPRLTENGVLYLTPEERTQLFGDRYEEKSKLYSDIWESAKGQSLVLSGGDLYSLSEYMDMLSKCEGDYAEKLAALFPGGGLMTKTGET